MSGEKRSNPWERDHLLTEYLTPDELYYFKELGLKRPKFRERDDNMYLNIQTKRAAIKAAPSVVALVSYSGEEELVQGSGTIIERNINNRSIVLTSAKLIRRRTDEADLENTLADNLKVVVHLCDGKSYVGEVCAHDFHYNVAAIQFESDYPVATAKLAHVDDSISLDPREEKSFQLRPHSNSSKLVPGDAVIVMGRYFAKPFDLMAAPGEFSLDRCEYDCKELFKASCIITKCGDGGPLINHSGEVIGITYYDFGFTPFMPINIAYKWWEHYKRYGKSYRPSLGMEATNFYATDLHIIEKIIQNFPSISKGVIVEKVMPGSSADSAGIRVNDVIVQCDGKTVQSFLEFFEIIWDKVGDRVELVVARPDQDTLLHLKMVVEATSDNVNSWPSRY